MDIEIDCNFQMYSRVAKENNMSTNQKVELWSKRTILYFIDKNVENELN